MRMVNWHEHCDASKAARQPDQLPESFAEVDPDRLAFVLVDELTEVGLDRQLVIAVAEGHEGAPEGVAVDGSSNFHKAAGRRIRHSSR